MDRLYRSRTDRMVAGVAGGLAERLEADPAVVRVVWAVLVLVTGGFALLVYIIMALVVPEGSAAAGGGPADPVSAQPPAPAGRRGNGGGTIVVGLALVVIGGALLLERLMPAFDVVGLWPFVIIGIGVLLVVGSVRRNG